ncbi:DUF2079 domain-containing protein [Sanguibacter suaedae]|uniref:DUF2079 domain-containing protein n=1 Tax=Sanguibacter suaedae TaxID=2795737 RepID=A0A934MAQ5_9MICO|nr:DUF2079 domain-containing protein [Sanguibacter suaedae]MBI9114491.1 DUF2079 domain-containing protein [Sanguibacter suaedae]
MTELDAQDTVARERRGPTEGEVDDARGDGRASRVPVWGLASVAFLAYLVLSVARWYRWDNPSWDLAIFEQAVRGWAEHGVPIVTVKGPDFHQLGDHFSPFLVVLAPFYALFPTPLTLLVAQCVLVAGSVVPVALTARRLLGPWRGLALAGAYAFSWGVQSAVDVQFHEYALAVPLLALGLTAFLEGRWRASAVWVALLLGVKEDLGLTVAAFGVVLWLRGQRALGAITAGVGVVGMALVVGVVVPAFNPQGRYDYWGRLGEDDEVAAGAGDTVGGALQSLAGLLTPAVKLETLALLGLLTVFVALRSSLALLVVPTLLWRFAGSTEFYWGTTWHYSLILMPVLFAAAIDGLRSMQASPWRASRLLARVAPGAMVVVALVLLPRFPLSDLWDPESYRRDARFPAAQGAVDAVPEGATVASDRGLIVQLATDRRVYWIVTDPAVRPQYVVVDQHGWGGKPPMDVAAYAEGLYPGTDYEIVYDEQGYVVARRL